MFRTDVNAQLSGSDCETRQNDSSGCVYVMYKLLSRWQLSTCRELHTDNPVKMYVPPKESFVVLCAFPLRVFSRHPKGCVASA